MQRKLSGLLEPYRVALRKYLKQDPPASLEPAHGLGCQAVALHLGTLDMARIHEAAVAALEASNGTSGLVHRAKIFFAAAITPIEKTHHPAPEASARLSQLKTKVGQRTIEVAASNRSLKQGIAQRKSAELALKKSGGHCKNLLEESLSLQKHLQHLTHRILSAQEDKRKQMSHDLQDEIAQTLLGINVRLLTLKRAAGLNAKSLQEELANTKRLVDMSAKAIRRFAREYAKHHEP